MLDTRIGVDPAKAPVAAGGGVHLQVAGRGGVPASGVSAVALNVSTGFTKRILSARRDDPMSSYMFFRR